MDENNLDHSKLKLMIEGLQGSMSNHFNALTIDIKASNDLAEKTLAQTKKTNGRVNNLEEKVLTIEKEIEIIRFVKRRKWMIALFFMAFMYAYENFKMDWLLKKLGL